LVLLSKDIVHVFLDLELLAELFPALLVEGEQLLELVDLLPHSGVFQG